jgi:hypothetical protein
MPQAGVSIFFSIYFSVMPQVDISIFFSIIFSVIKSCAVCYGILFVYFFYPFISNIKLRYNFFSKTKQVKDILIRFF